VRAKIKFGTGSREPALVTRARSCYVASKPDVVRAKFFLSHSLLKEYPLPSSVILSCSRGMCSSVLRDAVFGWYAADPTRFQTVWEMNAQTQKKAVSLRLLDWLVTNYACERKVSYRRRKDEGNPIAQPFNLYGSYRSHLRTFRKTNFDPFRRGERFYFDGERERPEWAAEHEQLQRRVVEHRENARRFVMEATSTAHQHFAAETQDTISQAERCKILAEEEQQLMEEAQTEATLLEAKMTTIGQLNFFKWAITSEVLEFAAYNRIAIETHMTRKGTATVGALSPSPLSVKHDPARFKKRRVSACSRDALTSSSDGHGNGDGDPSASALLDRGSGATTCVMFRVGKQLVFPHREVPKSF
jgi:hypothetical protein